MYLQEAFRALDALNEDTFSVSDDGINKLAEFQNNDDLEDEIKVIDPDAETEEDLQDSYVGKVILDCAVCHSKLYKDREEVELDEEGVMANVGEECPYCYTSDGFKVIGEVAAFGKNDEATEETDEDDQVEESLTRTPSEEEITSSTSETSTETLAEGIFDKSKSYKGFTFTKKSGVYKITGVPEGVDMTDVRPYSGKDEADMKRIIDTKILAEPDEDTLRAARKSQDMLKAAGYHRSDANDERIAKDDRLDKYAKKKANEKAARKKGEESRGGRDRYNASSDTYESFTEAYEDTDGIMGEKGTKWTEDQLRTYFDSEKDNDPVLKVYKGNVDKWMQDTLKGMKKVNESVKVNGENLSYAVINPDGTYAGAPCTSEEEARELAAQKEGRVVVKLEAVKNGSKSIKENLEEIRIIVDEEFPLAHQELGNKSLNDYIDYFKQITKVTSTMKKLITDYYNAYVEDGEIVNESRSIKESVNNVNVETDDSIVNVSTDDNGKVTVTTEPNEAPVESGDEIIAPVSPETQAEIEMGSEEAPVEDEFVDMEVDEFDEESFDGLGESYLKKVYENVDSYKTTSIKENGNSIVVEGVINFKSGKAGKTSFLFEAKDCTKDGRVRFVGENAQLTKGKKSFTISGKVANKKFIAESFNYNYRAKDKDGKSSRIYGTIKK